MEMLSLIDWRIIILVLIAIYAIYMLFFILRFMQRTRKQEKFLKHIDKTIQKVNKELGDVISEQKAHLGDAQKKVQ